MTDNNLPKCIGKYTIQDILGRGAMGVVYKGFDPHIQRTVAIKVIRKAAFADDELAEVLGRFKHEAQAAGRLVHPNIVTVYEYGEENDTAFIAMEYIEGKSLKELMADQATFTLAEVADILSQLLTGLHYAHTAGIVHRDIKPDNLIFTLDGTLKIMDFGVARLESSSLTRAGSVMGTPSYMAPELFTGEDIDQRSDLFSAGIILYQLLTGRKPFSGSSMTAIMHQVINVTPTNPSQFDNRLPAPLDRLMQTCLAKNPANRFQNGTDFLVALKKAFAKVDSSLMTQAAGRKASSAHESTCYECGPAPAPRPTLLTKIKHLPIPIFIGAALILLLIAAYFLFKNESTAPISEPEETPITSQHQKSAGPEPTSKILTPSGTKKQVTKQQPAKQRTGISISTPSSDARPKTAPDRPASRNAISITVPDRQ
ncbi:MAG: serine/threonine protein kinase [Proteobacteria bacterium]|nr:serine/threonine protein kinase [Pseudomonadota bacterium]MBU1639693.1 serine/threonine protein kinase [Pseudomonadota bacterium]